MVSAQECIVAGNESDTEKLPMDSNSNSDNISPETVSAQEKESIHLSAFNGEETEAQTRQVTGFRWFLVCLAIFSGNVLYGLDTTIAADIQAAISETFDNVTQLGWLGVGFTLGSTVTILPLGKVYARFDNKWVFISCLAMFSAGSALCGAALSMNALIVGRVWAGAGGAGVYLGTLNLVTVTSIPKEQPFYVGMTGFAYGSGCILGPIVGGSFADSSATWRWAFYLNLVIFGVMTPVYLFLLPSLPRQPETTLLQKIKGLDWLGTILTAGLYVSFTLAITLGGASWSWNDTRVIALIVASGVLTITFGLTQYNSTFTNVAERLFPCEFVRDPQLILLYVCMACGGAALFVSIYYIPFYFLFVHGDSGIKAAVRLLPFICFYVATILICGATMGRTGYHMVWYLVSGVFLTAGGATMYTVKVDTAPANIYGYAILLGLGMTTTQAGYAVGPLLVESDRVAELIQFLNISQGQSQLIGLTIASAIFQSLTYPHLKVVLDGTGYSDDEIRAAIAGARSRVLETASPELRARCIDAIVQSIRDDWLLVVAAGAFQERGKRVTPHLLVEALQPISRKPGTYRDIARFIISKNTTEPEEFNMTLPKTFKQAVFKAPGAPLTLEDANLTPPGKGEILVQVQACGTELMNCLSPIVPGHEIIGFVGAVGDDSLGWQVGDRVGGAWHGGHDGTCNACKKGYFQMCDNAAVNGETRGGGYAQYCKLRAEAAVQIPSHVDAAKYAPILCAGVSVFNAIRKMNIPPGETIAIQGLGGLGHLAIQYANKLGYRVIALSRDSKKEKHARELGADEYIDASKGDVGASLQKLGGASLIVATAPSADAITPLLTGLGILGKLLILSVPGVIPVDTAITLRYGLSVQSWPSGHTLDAEEAIQFTELKNIDCMVEKFPLAKVNDAFNAMLSGTSFLSRMTMRLITRLGHKVDQTEKGITFASFVLFNFSSLVTLSLSDIVRELSGNIMKQVLKLPFALAAWVISVQTAPTFSPIRSRSLLGSSFGVPGNNATFEYVVVGGGTAGLTVATRLSEQQSGRVAVVEAGGFYEISNGNISQVPASDGFYAGTAKDDWQPLVDWGYVTTPQAVGFSGTEDIASELIDSWFRVWMVKPFIMLVESASVGVQQETIWHTSVVLDRRIKSGQMQLEIRV
ncbi:MAG: hypothetical protein Q9167_003520 [Letrouitia subvulpina]